MIDDHIFAVVYGGKRKIALKWKKKGGRRTRRRKK